MSKRYAILGLSVFFALALAVPALGGPSNPVASVSASVKGIANKALKKAKAAQTTADSALSAANGAASDAAKAQTNATNAQKAASTAQGTATSALTTANAAKTAAAAADAKAVAADGKAVAAEANANTRIKESVEVAESTPENTSSPKFVSVSCPAGDPILGGGFSVGGEANKVTVSQSEEQLYGGGWFTDASAISGFTPTWSLTVLAVCGTK
jgi:hypothetical protein